MGADDDEDCLHDWVLQQVHLTAAHAGMAWGCALCGTVRYDDAQDAARPPLR